MSVNSLRKFKVSISEESRKIQGLQIGDIVRRQYYDGTNVIYTLMLVLSSGVDEIVNDEGEIAQRPYFIGGLLEGDVPETDQLLDFVRVTNLFNEDRLGALYLTASDEASPYMDILDGIGKNRSISWPDDIGKGKYEALDGNSSLSYTRAGRERKRILSVTPNNSSTSSGFKVDFSQYVSNPDRVIISYWVRNTSINDGQLTGSLEYVNGSKVDGAETYQLPNVWTYKVHVFTVDYSGRHQRRFKLISPSANSFEVADFNIILLSSVSNLGDASQIRWGKLDGIVDPVYGKLQGYGGYAQRLFIAGAANISGTLTAGDENGFGATFYAGRIHRNCFINSLSPSFVAAGQEIDTDIINPTGIGNVYKGTNDLILNAQTRAWVKNNAGKQVTLSFWLFAKSPCKINVSQDSMSDSLGSIVLEDRDLMAWCRCSVTYFVAANSQLDDTVPYQIKLEIDYQASNDSSLTIERLYYFSAPQIEVGGEATPYQATDEILEETSDYGAWFARGGIGGTMQNPLLKLNYDGKGSIATRNNSVLIKMDGSGHLANGNIGWDKAGNVTFGDKVVLKWENLSDNIKDNITPKSISIVGDDTMTIVRENDGTESYQPPQLNLKVECHSFEASEATFKWEFYDGNEWHIIAGAVGQQLSISPTSHIWNSGGDSAIIRCIAVVGNQTCYASKDLRIIRVDGYSVKITSDGGEVFKNGTCKTTLTANIYYKNELVTDPNVLGRFNYLWKKYKLPNIEQEVENWWVEPKIDRTAKSISLNYALSGQDYYTCSVSVANMFKYDFPIIF